MQHLDDGILQAWLDGPRSGLSASQRREVADHLASCEACSRRLEVLGELTGRVETLLAGPEPADEAVPPFEAVVARARTGAGGHAGEQRRRASRWTRAAWAASIAAAVGAGWLGSELYRGGGPAPRTAEAPAADSAAPVVVAAKSAAKPAVDTPSGSGAAGDKAPAQLERPAPPALPVTEAGADAGVTVATTTTGMRPAAPVASAPASPASERPTPAPTAEAVANDVASMDSAAAPPAVVRGRVTDASGRPLSAAQVVVDGTGVGTLTRADGSFELSLDRAAADSSRGPLSLTAQLIGYQAERQRLSTRAGGVTSADFRLAPQTVSLSEIVVTGASTSASRENAPRQGAVPPPPEASAAPWRVTTRADAEAKAGFRLLTVPDLLVTRIELGYPAGVPVVRVVQMLPDGARMVLVEARANVLFQVPDTAGGRAHASVQRGDVHIVGSAPVTDDALRALLDRLK